MAQSPLDVGLVEHIKADSIGEPGKRTFRIRIAGTSGAALLWMEKEQLQALSMAIDQLLAQLRTNGVGKHQSPTAASESGDFPTTFSMEMRVSRLGLGYDEENDRLALVVHDVDSEPDGPPAMTCHVSRGRMGTLSGEIATVVASGRPRCPLCGAPLMSGPHACPGSNGKSPHPITGPETQ